jgi:hypothetical protein
MSSTESASTCEGVTEILEMVAPAAAAGSTSCGAGVGVAGPRLQSARARARRRRGGQYLRTSAEGIWAAGTSRGGRPAQRSIHSRRALGRGGKTRQTAAPASWLS